LDPSSFGGLSALAFSQAPGLTASTRGAGILQAPAWSLIFSDTLIERLVGVAINESVSSLELLTRDKAPLTGNRWLRLRSCLSSLRLRTEVEQFFDREASEVFSTLRRQTATTLAHNDLHTRNVMIAGNGQAYFVDAASMSWGTPWAEDIARFSVWLACELFQSTSYEVPTLSAALNLKAAMPAATLPEWCRLLRSRVGATLKQYDDGWRHRLELQIDTEHDWQLMASAELLRAAYSAQTFDRPTRAAAVDLAFEMLTTLTDPQSASSDT
jgi:hypothetical protein